MRYIYAITRTEATGEILYPADTHVAGGIGFPFWDHADQSKPLSDSLDKAEHFTNKQHAARRAAFTGVQSPNASQLYRRPAEGGEWEPTPWGYLRDAWLPRQTWTKTASGWTLEFARCEIYLESYGNGGTRYRNRRSRVKLNGKTKRELVEQMRNDCEAHWVLPTS